MAANKRLPVKWIRDKAKAAYKKGTKCYICGSLDNLELHHLYSITELFSKWAEGKNIVSDDDILAVRDLFIEEHKTEIYTDVYTLCNMHHVRLHNIFGQKPLISTVEGQRNWIESQLNTEGGGNVTFAGFY